MKKYLWILIAVSAIMIGLTNSSFAKEEVNVYSYRQPILNDTFFNNIYAVPPGNYIHLKGNQYNMIWLLYHQEIVQQYLENKAFL